MYICKYFSILYKLLLRTCLVLERKTLTFVSSTSFKSRYKEGGFIPRRGAHPLHPPLRFSPDIKGQRETRLTVFLQTSHTVFQCTSQLKNKTNCEKIICLRLAGTQICWAFRVCHLQVKSSSCCFHRVSDFCLL